MERLTALSISFCYLPMSEHLDIASPGASKSEIYEVLLPQLKALIDAETDPIAIMANLSAAIHDTFGHLWVGFYRVVDDQLVLGPFQGPLACTRIRKGRGVCGTAWADERTLVIPDVEQFPGHIACSSDSRSEIVVPIRNAAGKVAAVLDIDSHDLATFDATDASYLQQMAEKLSEKMD